MINTLFFDMDDTLVSFDAVSDVSWRQAISAYCTEPNQVDAILGMIRQHSNWYWSDEERSRAGRMDSITARRTYVITAFAELGLPEEIALLVADMFSRVRIENMTLLPNTIETLTQLKKQKYKMALLTNGDSAGQRAKIARFGLEPFFDPILIEEELGFGKPDPRVFEIALKQLKTHPANALMIGDNLVWDVAGAQAVGIKAIWFNWRKGIIPQGVEVVPDGVVTDILQLTDAVDTMFG